mmetsp:Transcript_36208/g.95414  ORF Transcript_36208/g.95414 Transcript_36208/m.95414 type:complete len:299 (+) Transcript_36208:3102-3998(+)
MPSFCASSRIVSRECNPRSSWKRMSSPIISKVLPLRPPPLIEVRRVFLGRSLAIIWVSCDDLALLCDRRSAGAEAPAATTLLRMRSFSTCTALEAASARSLSKRPLSVGDLETIGTAVVTVDTLPSTVEGSAGTGSAGTVLTCGLEGVGDCESFGAPAGSLGRCGDVGGPLCRASSGARVNLSSAVARPTRPTAWSLSCVPGSSCSRPAMRLAAARRASGISERLFARLSSCRSSKSGFTQLAWIVTFTFSSLEPEAKAWKTAVVAWIRSWIVLLKTLRSFDQSSALWGALFSGLPAL